MRPTVSEQLAGARRILAEVIAPEVTGAYPVDMLRGVIANLEMLERSWTDLAPFLAWDNEGSERVLAPVARLVDADLAARITAALAVAPPDPVDALTLESRNTELRGLLADAVPQLAARGDDPEGAYAALRAHLRERIDRFPFTMSAPMPGAKR